MTTISVIIATYGGQEWMSLVARRSFPSTEGQGYDDIFTPHYFNGTRASSLNDGAAMANTDWLIFLDADDEFAPGYVGAMRRALEQHGDGASNVLFTPAVQHVRKGRPGAPAFMDRGISLRDDNWMVIGTMIHRDLFNRVGGFDEYPHGFEDWALWSKCFRVGARIVKVPDAVYRYFHNPQSAHKRGWRDRKWQVATHVRVKAELDAWEAAL